MFGNTFFRNGTRPSLLIKINDSMAVPEVLAKLYNLNLKKSAYKLGCEVFFKKIASHFLNFKNLLEIGNPSTSLGMVSLSNHWKLEIF